MEWILRNFIVIPIMFTYYVSYVPRLIKMDRKIHVTDTFFYLFYNTMFPDLF